jgi:phosphatidate cytidylyltransferase
MTRVLSGAALLVLAAALVWFAPDALFFAAAQGLLLAASLEYVGLAGRCGFAISTAATWFAAALTCSAFAGRLLGNAGDIPLDIVLMAALVALCGAALSLWREGADALGMASAALFPALYLGLPIGAMVSIRFWHGREALALLMLTVIVSDTAQYYSGRLFGRRLLAPRISPKKTVAGAVGGFVAGTLLMAVAGAWWMPAFPAPLRAVLGIAVVAAGIAGDLFESMLKRSAGVKDSSSVIPGHGGVLDRIDALLLAAPVYYVVLRYGSDIVDS